MINESNSIKKSYLIVFFVIIVLFFLDLTTKPNKKEPCVIKGNVSYYGGQLIYHMPGDYYYEATNPEYWFCTEEEAVEAGFRRTKR